MRATAARFAAVALSGALLITPGPVTAQTETSPSPSPTGVTAVTTALPAPKEYLAIALDFIEARAYRRPLVDWPTIRMRAEQRVAGAGSLSDAHTVIVDVVKALDDKHSSFTRPPDAARQTVGKYNGFGFLAVAPSRLVVTVTDGGPAALAGLRVGDRIDKVNGRAPTLSNGAVAVGRDGNGQLPSAIRLTWSRKGVKKAFTKVVRVAEVTLISVPRAAPVPPSANGQSFGRLGYLDIPGIVGDDAAQKAFATQVQSQIRSLENDTPRCGWIVDLRRNRGGYIYAMLAGLGPLLNGSAPSGSTLGGQRGAGGDQYLWTYVDGVIVVNDQKTVGVDEPVVLARSDVAVAVLTSPLTASAGEAVTIAFRGRPMARSFGEATDGLTTFNERKTLPDGAFLDIMSAVDMDRTGTSYEGPVPADQPIRTDWDNVGNDKDAVLQAASTWLSTQPSCAPA